jgi:hypothetical protein
MNFGIVFLCFQEMNIGLCQKYKTKLLMKLRITIMKFLVFFETYINARIKFNKVCFVFC